MKRLVILFFLCCSLTVFATPKPRHTPTPSPTPTATPGPNGEVEKGAFVCLPKQKWLELIDWFTGLHNENTKAQTDLAAALKSNADTQSKLDASQRDATALANECAADKKCAQAPLSCWFHRLMKHIFWIAGAALVVMIGLLIASFFFPALGPILSFFVSIWKWFLGLFTKKPPMP